MYCPKCGSPATEKQNFCRSCGAGLRTVAEILAGLYVIDLWKQPAAIRGLSICVVGVKMTALLNLLGKAGYLPAGDLTGYIMAIAAVTAIAGAILLIYAMLPKESNAQPSARPDLPNRSEQTRKMRSGNLSKSMGTLTEQAMELRETSPPRTPPYTTAPQSEQVE